MSNIKKLMGIVDSRSSQGIMARGKANYGIAGSPNPTGINTSNAAKLLLERRKKNGIKH